MKSKTMGAFAILAVGMLLFYSNCGEVGTSGVQIEPEPDPEAGEIVYKTTSSPTCISCHGADGTLEVSVDLKNYTEAQILTAVRVGPGSMPTYDGAELSNQQVRDLSAYLDTL